MATNQQTHNTPDSAFKDWKHFDDAPPLRPVRTYVITPEMRANDERQRKEREASRVSAWPIKATLSVENLRREEKGRVS